MAIAAHIIGSDESVSEHLLESGASLPVAGDQRVALPEVASPDAVLSINAADVLSVSVAADSVSFPGLLANIENETGSELSFADGVAIDTLGALLERVSSPAAGESRPDLAMADLIHDDLESGDLLYLNELSDLGSIAGPAGETLDLAELVEAGHERDALFEALDEASEQQTGAPQATDLWVATELGGAVHAPIESDIIDPLISIDDGIA